MMHAPPPSARPVGITLTPFSSEAGAYAWRTFGGTLTGAVMTAGVALFIPVTVPRPATMTHAFAMNSGTVSGNWDVGLYDEEWKRIVSTGSVAAAGPASNPQVVDIPDTVVGPGRYYLAFLRDGSGSNYGLQGTALMGAAAGYAQQSVALPLPATAAPVLFAQTFVPIFGLSRRATL